VDYGLYLAAASLIITIIGCTVKLTRSARDLEQEVRKDMDAQIDNVQRDIKNSLDRSAEREDRLRHEFGETASALRAKIHDVETWNRDNFVRKGSFEMVIGRIEGSIEKLGDKLEARIDKAIERLHGRGE
jgi:hypothetical protein